MASRARVFIGSSAEGRAVSRHLQVELGEAVEVVRWDQAVFVPGGYTLERLLEVAPTVDFAVLIATPDDTTTSREETVASPRDNIVLEFGLFAGVLGRKRTYLLATGDLKLPSDVLGLTRLAYNGAASGRAAISEAAVQIEERVQALGPLRRTLEGGSVVDSALDEELRILTTNARAQGWTVKTNNRTTLRLRTPRGRTFTLSKRQPEVTREDLRAFVTTLRAEGLRVNASIRRPVEESPH